MLDDIAKQGDLVSINYGSCTPGGLILQEQNKEPLDIYIGDGALPIELEDEIIGMRAGETKEIKIPLEGSYGAYYEEGVIEVQKDQIMDPDVHCTVGEQVVVQTPDEKKIKAVIKEVKGSNLILDLNHPLAGQNALVKIELLEIL